MITRKRILISSAFLVLACATPRNADLDRVQARYDRVSAGGQLDEAASVDLYEAGKQLERARDLLGDADAEVVSHHAHLADVRIDIAEVSADTRKTRAEADGLLAERQRLRLEARTTEADRAALRARAAEAEAVEARQEAAAAEARARDAELERAELQAQLEDLETRQTERGLLLTLGGVLFEFGKADLKSGAKTQLGRVAGFLIANPDRDVVVEGHTDDVGSDQTNLLLSRARANSVRDFLMLQGVSGERIVAEGFGKIFPVASNETDSGRAQNRRVEIVILDPGVSAASALRRR